jgi:hypothetical protein
MISFLSRTRALRVGAGFLLAADLLLAAGDAAAQSFVVDDTSGAVYDGILDGFPGLALFDGEPDFGENPPALALKAGVTEERTVAEFPLPPGVTAATLRSSTVVFNIDDVLSTFGPGTDFSGRAARRIYLHLYAGNGVAELSDFKRVERPGHLVDTTIHGTITDATLRQSGPLVFRVDVTADVSDLLLGEPSHVGVVWRTDDSPTGTSIDDLGDGGAGPPGVNGARLPFLEIELGVPVSPTSAPVPSATSTPTPSPAGTATRTVTASATPTATPVSTIATSSPKPSSTGTATPTASGSPNPTPGECTGDCNNDSQVTVDELVRGVKIALGNSPPDTCPNFDADKTGTVTIDELVRAVAAALGGC